MATDGRMVAGVTHVTGEQLDAEKATAARSADFVDVVELIKPGNVAVDVSRLKPIGG